MFNKEIFSIIQQKTDACVQALMYSLTFEKAALCEKSTFQPPVNVSEFGL
jgi:hypothetical protein